jgi:nicotinic acid phosphoribosyltransferase
MTTSHDPVDVFAGTAWEAALVKSLLENAEIEVFLKDEIRGTMAPWHISPGGTDPVKVVVSGADYEKAMEVVRDFENNRNS